MRIVMKDKRIRESDCHQLIIIIYKSPEKETEFAFIYIYYFLLI
jgi:hypothetical protein